MKNYAFFFLLFLAVTNWSCQSDETLQALSSAGDCTNCINFGNLQVGQQSRYIAFAGNWYQDNRDFKYQKDTLVVKVAAQAGENFVFEEFRLSDRDSVRIYNVVRSDDSIKIELPNYYRSSWLFSNNPYLYLDLEPSSYRPTEIKGWEAFLICDTAPCYGYLSEYEQQRLLYKDLYVYHDYSPIAYDGTGYFAIYNKNYGLVRIANTGGWTAKANGWDLLLE